MSKYKMLPNGCISNTENGRSWKPNPDNRDHQEFLQWKKEGGIVAPADEIVETWQEKRIKAYGPLSGQFDEMYWDQINGTTVWRDRITQIKEDIPKD